MNNTFNDLLSPKFEDNFECVLKYSNSNRKYDYKIETINNLKHIKNEIRFINALQKKYDYN